jgi:hypothetical protein
MPPKETTYKGFTIVTHPTRRGRGWALLFEVYSHDGEILVHRVDMGAEFTFATKELADQAGVKLAQHWIDHLEERGR